MPPVLGFGFGERKALYSQTWEEEMSKKLILRCLLEEQDMSAMLRDGLLSRPSWLTLERIQRQ